MNVSAPSANDLVEFSPVPGLNQRMIEPDKQADVSDIALVAKHGDRDAFKRIFEHFSPRVSAYLVRLGANRDLAEDLVQDVFMLVWRRAYQFDARKAALSTWIYTIARNRWIDVLRREKRPELDADDPTMALPSAPRGDDTMEVIEASEQVRLAIAELPAEQAEMLKVFYFEDKSHTAIAEELGVPLGTVKSRLRLALNKLKGHFAGMDI